MSRTIVEQILSRASARDVRAGEITVCDLDWVVGTDGSMPMAIEAFREMGGTHVFNPSRVVCSLDHYAPPTSPSTVEFHRVIREFARAQGIRLLGVGEGISHQVVIERGWVRPGQVLVGADSHAVTCGALNMFATGIGSSELAAAMLTGQMWFRVPESIRVTVHGKRRDGVSAKDIALSLVGRVGADGANYQSLEFDGPSLPSLTLEDRLVLSNLAVEMGAKAAIFPFDAETRAYLHGRGESGHDRLVAHEPGARYAREIDLDLGAIDAQVARPHAPDRTSSLADVAGTPVHMVFLGTCTGGRVVDFHEAWSAFAAAGGRVAAGVQLVITPASREVHEALDRDGTLGRFMAAGAEVTMAGCGACCGTSGVIPGDGMTVVSTANRNFKARMGNATASIYLASPATCGRAAATGHL